MQTITITEKLAKNLENLFIRHEDWYKDLRRVMKSKYADYVLKVAKKLDVHRKLIVYHTLCSRKVPKCSSCGKLTKFHIIRGYQPYCSKDCCKTPEALVLRRKRIIKTNLERYGVDNPAKIQEVTNRRVQTNLERYGVEHAAQSPEILEHSRQTYLKHYGVDHPTKNRKIRDKIKNTIFERYGVEHVMQSAKFKNKAKRTNLKRYGGHPMQNEAIKNKQIKTNLERYGFECSLQSKEVQKKVIKTNLRKYGVKHISESAEIREKSRETMLERYGVEYSGESQELLNKMYNTNMKRYGVKHAVQSEEIQSRSRETSTLRYGVPHPMQNAKILKLAQDNLYEHREYVFEGKHFWCQGFDHFLIERLVNTFGPKRVNNDPDKMPFIWYKLEGRRLRYFPDAIVGNRVYEAKSTYTFSVDFAKNRAKARASIAAGYSYKCVVFNKTGDVMFTTRLTRTLDFYRKFFK